MAIYREEDLWGQGSPEYVVDGEVFTWDDRPVHFRALVQRRWGWTKKAAYQAADHLLAQAQQSGRPAVLWLSNPHRSEQQQAIMDQLGPDVLRDLLTGLARVGQREVHDASHQISSVTIRFNDLISDDGLTKGILAILANRLGCNLEQLREAVKFDTGTSDITCDVDLGKFGL